MRRRERAYALVLATICTLSLLGGAWPIPLLAFALIEAAYTAVELAAAQRCAPRGARTRARSRGEPAGGILCGTP